ncbi:hypothetical protein ABVC54_00915 [Lactobacillus gasseri]|uniref:hypothetical protein n=1 Tax=Lactobacillus TaxID=1578 RepID=UPI00118FC749|nr:hypothetical protein [Lactobacillus jensenii]MDK7308828.1 hypothetical protein [Lactobacillus jensenii]TVV22601.1 hypothetical protein FOF69_00580 [Lactobacillus jensenii]
MKYLGLITIIVIAVFFFFELSSAKKKLIELRRQLENNSNEYQIQLAQKEKALLQKKAVLEKKGSKHQINKINNEISAIIEEKKLLNSIKENYQKDKISDKEKKLIFKWVKKKLFIKY